MISLKLLKSLSPVMLVAVIFVFIFVLNGNTNQVPIPVEEFALVVVEQPFQDQEAVTFASIMSGSRDQHSDKVNIPHEQTVMDQESKVVRIGEWIDPDFEGLIFSDNEEIVRIGEVDPGSETVA